MVALACGNTVIWKPSLTSLVAIATHKIMNDVCRARTGWDVGLIIGSDQEIGETMIQDSRLLISATGSTRMGRHVNQVVAGRLGRCLLELGGNNGLLSNQVPISIWRFAVFAFGAVGTTGQRCTSTRLYLHKSIAVNC